MTFPTFSAGEVLRAQDMNAVGSWLVRSSSFTAQDLIADSVFSADYTRYVLKGNITLSNTASEVRLQYRSSAANNATSNYTDQVTYFATSAVFSRNTTPTTSSLLFPNAGAQGWQFSIEIYFPAVAAKTITITQGNVASGDLPVVGGTGFAATTVFDGIRIFPTLGTITGNYTIHGYND